MRWWKKSKYAFLLIPWGYLFLLLLQEADTGNTQVREVEREGETERICEKWITWTWGMSRKSKEGVCVGLCPAAAVAGVTPLLRNRLAELQWPRAICEQIRLPLCVHYFLLTFAKHKSSWPWEIDEGPKMPPCLPGPFMLSWEQWVCYVYSWVCFSFEPVCMCVEKGEQTEKRENTMWLLCTKTPAEFCFWQPKIKVMYFFFIVAVFYQRRNNTVIFGGDTSECFL